MNNYSEISLNSSISQMTDIINESHVFFSPSGKLTRQTTEDDISKLMDSIAKGYQMYPFTVDPKSVYYMYIGDKGICSLGSTFNNSFG
jgi:hypothetical protein